MLLEIKNKLKENGEIYLRVKARPGASKNEIKDIMADGSIKIDISAPPVGGKANKELIKFLSQEFVVPKDNIKIISGAGDKIKLIKIVK